MAIAPSKLGRLVYEEFGNEKDASDDRLLTRLRNCGLVRPDATDAEVLATFRAARDEHAAGGYSHFNSPHERVRVFLEPYLTDKGKLWAEPIKSLQLPDG
jgi:hypothetical protein